MSKIGFWETFFDENMSWREASAINEAHDAISTMQAVTATTSQAQAQQLQKLFALDRAQAQQIERMAATIDVLTELLLETGAIDRAALTERVTARVNELEKVEAEAKARGPQTSCARCGAEVPAKNTQITETGTVCDRCYYS